MRIEDFIEQGIDWGLQLDGVITDAPYDHLEKHRNIGTTTRLQGAWFDVLSMDELTEIMNQMKDILSRGSHIYFWGNTHSTFDFKDMFRDLGYTFNNCLFWVKPRIGLGYNYRNKCEPILFVSNGKRRQLRDQGQSNVFTYPKPKNMPSYAKPHLIYRDIMRSASRAGEVWADIFAGTDPFSRLNNQTYTVKYKKKYYVWKVPTISVDIKYPPEAYSFHTPPLHSFNVNDFVKK